ncbi:LysM peptidoglycan-binding domain-containing protein [Archangium gephyra]|uniref:VgrG-related protein n=1 Tax=Archangium gephyra TaxID=48 RepID=UPI0035D48D6E
MSTYRIRSGDTLSGIARRHNTTVDELARANKIEDPNQIRAGERLQIPDGFDAPSTQGTRRRPRGRPVDTFTPATRPQARASAAPTSATRPPNRPARPGTAAAPTSATRPQARGSAAPTSATRPPARPGTAAAPTSAPRPPTRPVTAAPAAPTPMTAAPAAPTAPASGTRPVTPAASTAPTPVTAAPAAPTAPTPETQPVTGAAAAPTSAPTPVTAAAAPAAPTAPTPETQPVTEAAPAAPTAPTPETQPVTAAPATPTPGAAPTTSLRPEPRPDTSLPPLGTLSSQYESRGDVGSVSDNDGDPGGPSYGTYQIATNTGTAQEFVDSLATSHPEYHAALSPHEPGTQEFGQAWRDLAASEPEGFGQAQHEFIVDTHYQPQVDSILEATGLDLNRRSAALRDVAWSTGVQHRGTTPDIFEAALAGRDPATVTDEELIEGVYAERGRTNPDGTLARFHSSSPDIQRGVANRFVNEQADALEMLARERMLQAAGAIPATAGPVPEDSAANAPIAQQTPAGLTAPTSALIPPSRPEGLTAPPGMAAQVQMPWYSQFDPDRVERAGNQACFRAVTAMARDAGVTVQGPDRRIQVGTSENEEGRLTVDSARAQQGREYIDGQLDAGRPVVVGVSHKDADYNVDTLTDHFVAITGRGVDEQGRTFYTFHDPGTRHTDVGMDTNPNNRFYVDGSTGMMYRPAQAGGGVDHRGYDVSMVRLNAQ